MAFGKAPMRLDSKYKKILALSSFSFLIFTTSCRDSGPSFLEKPTVRPNPNPSVPLAGILRFQADCPVSTRVVITDGIHDTEAVFDSSWNPPEGIPLLGMRPDRSHEIQVYIIDEAGAETAADSVVEFRTPPLPADREEFPPLEVTVVKTEEMEPGITLFNPRRRKIGAPLFNQSYGMLLAVDPQGEPVWYYRVDSRISDFEKLRNGNLIVLTQDYRLIEIDWLGNTIHQWYAKNRPDGPAEGIAVDALTFHHEVDELPNGNIIVLGTEIREIENYYTSEYESKAPRKTQKVVGDVILEFIPETGEIVWEWKAFEHMDPFRIGYETFSNYWGVRGFPDSVDWSHANNLLYDEQDDSVVVNFRYQAAAMKIDRKTKEIKWIFGEPSGWGDLSAKVLNSDGEIHWPYHQHSPHPTPNGTLLIYDNGNYQARPFNRPKPLAETYSRAVEYEIDEKQMKVREIWSSEIMGPDRVVSIAMGDVDWLPQTENILVAYGALLDSKNLDKMEWEPRSRQQFSQWTRLREYKRTNPAEVVWEIVIQDKAPMGWTLFGAARLPRVGP